MKDSNTYSMFDFDHSLNEKIDLGLNKKAKKKFDNASVEDATEEFSTINTETVESMVEDVLEKLRSEGNPVEENTNRENSISYEQDKSNTVFDLTVIKYTFWKPGTRVTEVEEQAPSMFLEIAFTEDQETNVIDTLAFTLCITCNRKAIRCHIDEYRKMKDIPVDIKKILDAIYTIGHNQKDIATMFDQFYIDTAKPKDQPWIFWPTNAIIKFEPLEDTSFVLTPKWKEKMDDFLGQMGFKITSTRQYNSFI